MSNDFENMINTIQFGDCYDLLRKIPDNSIDCIYVDVPYLYHMGGGGNSELAQRTMKKRLELRGIKEFSAENLRIAKNKINSSNDFQDLSSGFDYKKFIKEAFRIMKKTNIFIWCSPMQILDIMNELSKYSDKTITILAWCKTNPIPTTNNLWLSDIEYCLYLREEGIKLNDGYELKSKWFVSPINKTDKDLYGHPTIKPLELVKRHLLHVTQENDLILDCFCGSGTTCVAAKEINRRYIGMEINKDYYEIAKKRINGITANGQMSIFTNFEEVE